MLPYLHILVRVEDDGSLHALGAFSCREKQQAYLVEAGLTDSQVRLDFHNGPFPDDTKVIYAGHRRWNMNCFQLAGYFNDEHSAWDCVTPEGYVSVLRIDMPYRTEKELEQQALQHYAHVQKRWHLSSYKELVKREGADRARATITLRFYQDSLQAFNPQTSRTIPGRYALSISILTALLALLLIDNHTPSHAENLASVDWLPPYASDIGYYRSPQIEVYEFKVSEANFQHWAASNGMQVTQLNEPRDLMRYKAYLPNALSALGAAGSTEDHVGLEQLQAWQQGMHIRIERGLLASSASQTLAIYDPDSGTAYVEQTTPN